MQETVYDLEIRKMLDGGFLVVDAYRGGGMVSTFRFASSTIEEALEYVKSKLEPTTAK